MLFLAVMMALLWSGYWFVVYRLADRFVSDASATQTSESAVLGCAERQFGGFPFLITIRCEGAVTAPSRGAQASLAYLAVRAALYNPGRIEVETRGPLQYEGVNHLVRADWRNGQLDVLAGLDGVNEVLASFTDLGFTVTDRVDDPIWSAAAVAWSTEIRPARDNDNSLHVVLTAEELVVTIGGDSYPRLSGTASLTMLDTGGGLDRGPDAIIGAWLGAGGAFDVDHMALTSGNLVAEITGPMTLEIDGTLSGALVVRYSGEEDLPLLIAAIFPWLADEAGMVSDAVRVMSRSIEVRGEPAYEARITLNHGTLSVGLIPILSIPSIGPLGHYL